MHTEIKKFVMICSLLAICISPKVAAADITPLRVLIVYKTNSADTDHDGKGDSQQLAEYYAQKRGVPQTNLLGVNISTSQYYYYQTAEYVKFYNDLVLPIKNKLSQVGPQNIDVILLAGNIPTVVYNSSNAVVSLDNALMGINALSSTSDNISKSTNPYFEPTPTFGSDLGHFSHSSFKYGGADMYLVSRLGSDDNFRGMDQIDQAIYADKYLYPQDGYFSGNMYVDSRYGQSSTVPYTDEYLSTQTAVQSGAYSVYADGDKNIAYAEHYITPSGFPLKWENTGNDLDIGQQGAKFSDGTSATTAPRALFYGGWYNYGNYNDVYDWLPGSFAVDLNSTYTFGLQALKHGASAASYVRGEPYLNGHQRPNIAYYYLLNGYTFAEASTLATPNIGWMEVNEGDPLYAPTKPKTPVKDTSIPVMSAGYPIINLDKTTGKFNIDILVDDSPNPEVVKATVDYGLDTNYGNAVTSTPGYKRRMKITLPLGLEQVYHYRITLTDPVGNVYKSPDYTISTVTGNNVVTYSNLDFAALITAWLHTSTTSDFNFDNIVDTRDLGIMMTKWNVN